MAAGLSWSHALFQVHLYDEMLAFYSGLLGFEVTNTGDFSGERKVAFLSQSDADHHQIAFISGRSADENPPQGNHFAFRVADLTSVKSWHAKLNADDRVKQVTPVTHGNAWSVYFSDPDGNGIEIFCDSPWHVAQPAGESWDPTLDDGAIAAATLDMFKDKPEFQPIDEYYQQRRIDLANR